jgi:hypothetical protein
MELIKRLTHLTTAGGSAGEGGGGSVGGGSGGGATGSNGGSVRSSYLQDLFGLIS